MRRIRKVRVFVLAVPIALAYVGGTALADPNVVQAMGLDVWRIGQLERELRMSQSRESKLERDLQTINDRATVHNLMLDDLIHGRVTLVETARRKWEMNQHRQELRDHLELHCFGPTMEARMAYDLCESVASKWAGGNVDSAGAATIRRVRAEYEVAYGVAYRPRCSR